MIDKRTLDEILPVPELEKLKDAKIRELQEGGFIITNFHPGGVFYSLLMITLRIKIEVTELLRTVLNNMFLTHSRDIWLDVKAADFSKKRKTAQKAQGLVTVSRLDTTGEAIKIPAGHIFKTTKDINGEELRFFSIEAAVLQKGSLSEDVLVEAETEGARYNVPAGQIARSLTYLGEVNITNSELWLQREGSDTEDDESLRARCLRSWSELATRPIHDTYMNIAKTVPGVLYAVVDDHHPRGQGSVDVIITSEAGQATDALLAEVLEACQEVKAPDDNLLIKSAEIVIQPVDLHVTILDEYSREGLEERIIASVTDLMRVSRGRDLNELTHADIIHKLKSDIEIARNVTVNTPAQDILLPRGYVILPGDISVTIQGV